MPVWVIRILWGLPQTLFLIGGFLVIAGCIRSTGGFRFWWHLLKQNLRSRSESEDCSAPLFLVSPTRGRLLIRLGSAFIILGLMLLAALTVVI